MSTNNIIDFERLHYGEATHKGINPPITDTSTFWFDSAQEMAKTFEGETQHFLYGRHSTPTHAYLGKALATLEGTEAAHLTASGMGAISSTVLQLCKAGDEIISSRTVYGGTYAFLKYFLPRFSIKTRFVDITRPEEIAKAVSAKTKLIYCESVSNPLMEVADIPVLAGLAKKNRLKLVVDNTFSPLSITPAEHGADLVIHSLTKYINGASDGIGGVICGAEEFIDALRDVNGGAAMLLGPTMDNQRAASILKNTKTLPVRMQQHSRNASYIARQLEKEGLKIMYPGLQRHPSYDLYSAIGNSEFGYGGMLTMDAGTKAKAFALMQNLQQERLGYLAVSLGSYGTLFSSPGTGTSSEIPEEVRLEMGLTDSLVRFSIGLDHRIEDTCEKMKGCMREVGIL